MPEFMLTELESTGSATLLARHEIIEIAQLLAQVRLSVHPTAHVRLLAGVPGVGKSVALYMLAEFCRRSGWCVLYVPNMLECSGMDADTSARHLLAAFVQMNAPHVLDRLCGADGRTAAALLSAHSAGTVPAADCLEQLIAVLRTAAVVATEHAPGVPVCVAVDKHNAMLGSLRYHFLNRIFGRLVDLKPTHGAALLALSSKFLLPRTISVTSARYIPWDSCAGLTIVTLGPLREAEYTACVSIKRAAGRLPTPQQGLSDSALSRMTGRLLIILAFVERVWLACVKAGGAAATWDARCEQSLRVQHATPYFMPLAYLLFRRCRLAEDMTDSLAFAGSLYINEDLSAPERWLESGLFVRTDAGSGPICPIVVDVIRSLVELRLRRILTTLASLHRAPVHVPATAC